MSVVCVLAARSTQRLQENSLCLKYNKQTTIGMYSQILDSIISTTSDSSVARRKFYVCQQVHRTQCKATLLRKTVQMTTSC